MSEPRRAAQAPANADPQLSGVKARNAARQRMDESELKAIIRRELNMGLGVDGGLLSQHRRQALEYYDGELFGNEIDGRSQVVMRTVLETVEWVLPALLRLFTASDKIVEFEPTVPGQLAEAAADQATRYVNYIIRRDNPGFMVLHDWFKDALLQKVGWVKVWWDRQRVEKTNSYTGLTEQEYAALKQPSDASEVEVVEERSYPAPMPGGFLQDAPDPDAAAQRAMLYDCTLKVTRTEGRVKIEPVPPEEVITSRRAKNLNPQNTPFVCHKRQRTFTDLLEEGYTEDQLENLVGDIQPEYNIERVTRYEDEDDFPYQSERTDKPMREIWIEENYLRVDWDNDGKAELRCVTTAGGAQSVLKNEPCDEIPLIPICPIPQPHKLVGMSVADLVMDLQFIISTLIRQMLDNLYLTNNPRTIVGRGGVTDETYDDLLTSRPGGIIRANDASQIVPSTVPFVAESAFPMVEYLHQVAETRSGISRHNQGLNPDDLNKTATGVNLIQQAAAQRVELIGAIFANTGVQQLGKRILGLVARYQQHERVIRVTGKWVPMDPAQWKDEMNVACAVGLGTGNRDQIIAHLMQILQIQQGIVTLQGGIQGPLVTAPNVYDVLEKLTENAGFQQSFFSDPAQMPQGAGQPPPDPKAQAEAQKAQIQAHAAQQQAQQQIALKQMQAQVEMEITRQKATLQAQLEQQKASQDMEIERQKALHQMELERMRTEAKIAVSAMTGGRSEGSGAAGSA